MGRATPYLWLGGAEPVQRRDNDDPEDHDQDGALDRGRQKIRWTLICTMPCPGQMNSHVQSSDTAVILRSGEIGHYGITENF